MSTLLLLHDSAVSISSGQINIRRHGNGVQRGPLQTAAGSGDCVYNTRLSPFASKLRPWCHPPARQLVACAYAVYVNESNRQCSATTYLL